MYLPTNLFVDCFALSRRVHRVFGICLSGRVVLVAFVYVYVDGSGIEIALWCGLDGS